MSFKQKLIIGLADEEVGARVGNVLQHTTATDAALTVGATSLQLGVTGGLVGFLGAAATARPSGVTLNNVTSIANALANLGLIATTTP
jgi:hypothetical protein